MLDVYFEPALHTFTVVVRRVEDTILQNWCSKHKRGTSCGNIYAEKHEILKIPCPDETFSYPDETFSYPDETFSYPDETFLYPDETFSHPDETVHRYSVQTGEALPKALPNDRMAPPLLPIKNKPRSPQEQGWLLLRFHFISQFFFGFSLAE